ncbi:MAG: uroporphyrinogen decarboxylase family protein [Capsulimonadaceae bacterium]|nr:uroporphyrinogen decarboxylase family protein [Capsulimonadaceae bacterium]
MSMTSRERVMRTLEFNHPDRVPRQVWLLPAVWLENDEAIIKAFLDRWPADITGPPVNNPALAALCSGDAYKVGKYRDEWGCEFVSVSPGRIGEVKQPFISDWNRLESVRPPVEALEFDRDAVNAFCRASGQFVMMGACARPFERMQFLRGTENLYMDIAEESDELKRLIEIVHGFYVTEMEAWARTDVDALSFMDDWGSQRSLLISPAQWRRLFKPLYAQYAQIARAHGKKIFMHSDGHIESIYDDLIEIGVDAVNSQLFCMNIEEIGKKHAGKITFWGEIDRQHVLASDNPEDARAAVRRVVDNLYSPAGGVIAQFEMMTNIAQGHAVFEAWEEFTGK